MVISEGSKIPGVTVALAFLVGTVPLVDTIHAQAHALLPPLLVCHDGTVPALRSASGFDCCTVCEQVSIKQQ